MFVDNLVLIFVRAIELQCPHRGLNPKSTLGRARSMGDDNEKNTLARRVVMNSVHIVPSGKR